MKPINVEISLGHNIGVSASYYKPRESEILEDYLKAVELLTISNDKTKLTKQVAELKEKSKDTEYIVKGKLQEKDDQINALTQQFSSMQSQIQSLIATLSESKDQHQLNQTAQILYKSGILSSTQ